MYLQESQGLGVQGSGAQALQEVEERVVDLHLAKLVQIVQSERRGKYAKWPAELSRNSRQSLHEDSVVTT